MALFALLAAGALVAFPRYPTYPNYDSLTALLLDPRDRGAFGLPWLKVRLLSEVLKPVRPRGRAGEARHPAGRDLPARSRHRSDRSSADAPGPAVVLRPGGGASLRAGAASVDLDATPAFGRPADHAGLICALES